MKHSDADPNRPDLNSESWCFEGGELKANRLRVTLGNAIEQHISGSVIRFKIQFTFNDQASGVLAERYEAQPDGKKWVSGRRLKRDALNDMPAGRTRAVERIAEKWLRWNPNDIKTVYTICISESTSSGG